MHTAKVALVIASCSIASSFLVGCASDGGPEVGQRSSALIMYDEKGNPYEVPDEKYEECKDGCKDGNRNGDPDVCTTTAIPELVHLVNFILSRDPAFGPGLVLNPYGGLEVYKATAEEEHALKVVFEQYKLETGKGDVEFADEFLDLQKRLLDTAVPAITNSTCGTPYPYFAVPFEGGDTTIDKLSWFFKRSQHVFIPKQPCDPAFVQANKLSRDGWMCAFVDPTWSSKGNNSSLSVQRYSGTAGNAWIPSATVAVTADPYTSIDPATGYTTVTFAAYRASGDPGIFSIADTSAVRITYGGTDTGVWQADVTSVPYATGSKGVLRLQYRIAP